ncbi:hypothetical protein L1987_14588 [Smallanthus sonchifolius]|uniref:Uncharacterized protein n=1 Tax=Smallanthus sonchifolius TaxID=185202 RepID=A0ACB9J420_9ASTR|nr:hypothetical protein L1987_14588 [Smallanthus sonchifolius]
MGRASRWFKRLLGMKKDKENMDNLGRKEKKRWSFVKPMKESPSPPPPAVTMAAANSNIPSSSDPIWLSSYMSAAEKQQNKHAIVVAAATAAAADAAVAAAQAAVAVVRLTGHGSGTIVNGGGRERWAAVRIQTVFRAHLGRKALRALRGLVKLQALVRGFLVRKRAAAVLYSMQALHGAQERRSQQWVRRSLKDHRIQPETRHRNSTERFDHEPKGEFHSKRLSTSYESTTYSYNESSKVVEIDTCRPHVRSSYIHTRARDSCEESHYFHNKSSPMHCNIQTRIFFPQSQHFQDPEWGFNGDHGYKFSNTTHSTPRLAKSIASHITSTPTKSVCGDGLLRAYRNHPSYMANTQSFNAKHRSCSAPKQRPEMGIKRRLSLFEIMASRSSLSGVGMQRSCSKAQEAINL